MPRRTGKLVLLNGVLNGQRPELLSSKGTCENSLLASKTVKLAFC